MKLAQFRYMDENRIGVALGDSLIVDVHEAAAGLRLPFNFPYTMREFIDFDTVALETVRFLLYQSERYPHRVKPIPLTEIEWLPPIRRPGKIVCLGAKDGESDEVNFWLKPPSSLCGHHRLIEISHTSAPIHPEPKLAVVIGKRATKVNATEALKFVYGYTIFNDVAGQFETEPLLRGSDTFGPMGPWLITKNEIPNPNELNVALSIEGEPGHAFHTSELHQTIEDCIELVSQFQTLEPGDVLALGVANKKPRPADLQHANVRCEVSITGIGELVNPISNGA